MSDYVTKADLETTYGVDLVKRLADHDGDGVADKNVIDKACTDAQAIIDTYLAVRYELPLLDTLAEIPITVKNLAVDIAWYRLAYNRAKQTAEMRQRYEDAIKLLERIADGKASLGIDTDEDEGSDDQGSRTTRITFHKRA